jgi:molybdopterin synthase sulfur carrier subunit
MKVRIKFFAYFREVFGSREKVVNLAQGATVLDLLNVLADSARVRGELFEKEQLKPHLVLMKNETNIHSLNGLGTALEDGDVIAIFPLMGGG